MFLCVCLHGTQYQGVDNGCLILYFQLYTLSQEPGRKEFLDSLFAYMQQNGKISCM